MNIVPTPPGYQIIMYDFEDDLFTYFDIICWILYRGKGPEEDGVEPGYVLTTPVTIYGEMPFSYCPVAAKHRAETDQIGVGTVLPNKTVQAVGGEIICSISEFEKRFRNKEIAY